MMLRIVMATLALLAATLPGRAEIEVQEITTPGGLDAWLVEEHSIPFVALELRFRGGTSLDAPGKRGAINLMTALLEEGAGEMDAQEFARARDALAASFSFEAQEDAIRVSARFLSENRDAALDLLRQALSQPRFDKGAIERVRGQVLSNLQSSLKDPNDLAARAFKALVYGDHPYGSWSKGTLDSVTALTRSDLKAAHKAAIARDRIYISAVGDITAEDLAALLDDLLADLPEAGAMLPGPATLNLPGGIKVEPFETPQSVVRFGQPGIDRDHPDFFAAYVLNHILGGGGFESRLMTEVREKRGLTYGIYSYLALRDNADIWLGSVASGNETVADTIAVIRAEWTRIREDGVTHAELEDAKTYLTGAYPLRFDGNGPIARIAVGMQLDDLPTDYIATRNDKVNAVTLADVNRVARQWLDPNALTFVVVGQPQGLETTLN